MDNVSLGRIAVAKPIKEVENDQCYKTDLGHPELQFDRLCTQCRLSCGEAVSGTGPDDLSKVRLIVLSDFPGAYETQYGWNQVPNTFDLYKRDKKITTRTWRNSGQFIREVIRELYGICPWTEVYYTNTLKCDPNYHGNKFNVSYKTDVSKCAEMWLRKEFEIIDKYNPTCPIIVGGKWALAGLIYLDPDAFVRQLSNNSFEVLKRDLINVGLFRRRKDLKIWDHPVAVTYNPAFVSKNDFRIEKEVNINRKTRKLEVNAVSPIRPILVGTPLWNFIKDIDWLTP